MNSRLNCLEVLAVMSLNFSLSFDVCSCLVQVSESGLQSRDAPCPMWSEIATIEGSMMHNPISVRTAPMAIKLV